MSEPEIYSVDDAAVRGLEGHITRGLNAHFLARAAVGELAGYEALNALALVTGQLIVSFADNAGQVYFEAALLAQIRHMLEQRMVRDAPAEGRA